MPIQYPTRSEGRAAFRRIVETFAQGTPITAALAHLYGYTHPSQFEKELEGFHKQVAILVNDHDERIRRVEDKFAIDAVLSPLALDLVFEILRSNTTGLLDPFVFNEIVKSFPGENVTDLETAAGELSFSGYANISASLSEAVRSLRPDISAFVAFDLVATGNDTRADAVRIASEWLKDDATRGVERLNEGLQWEPRRLNPALNALKHLFPQGRWSQTSHPRYITTTVLVTPNERFALQKIVNSGRID